MLLRKLFIPVLMCFGLLVASPSFAGDNAILDALKDGGVKTQSLDEAALNNVRGTGFVEGLVSPSYTAGVKEYHVTWKKFGSQTDYRSYNIVGSSVTPNQAVPLGKTTDNYQIVGFGDVWLADTKSNVNSWSRANSALAEYHLNALIETQPGSGKFQQTGIGYTESYWNRPLSTFNW